jgi:hypothetical protein
MDADAGKALAAVADQHLELQSVLALTFQQAGDILKREHHKALVRRMRVALKDIRVGVEHVIPVHKHLNVIVPVHCLQLGISDRIG